MEKCEKEIRKAFEETTIRNVNAILVHGNETRKRLISLERKMELLEKDNRDKNILISQLKSQLVPLQTILYRGRTE